jgi:hypothetical protein
MQFEDYSEWRKDFMNKAVLGSAYTELSYYNPLWKACATFSHCETNIRTSGTMWEHISKT